MFTRHMQRIAVFAAFVLALGITLGACRPAGIGQEDVDAIRDRLETVERRLDEVHALLTSALGEVEGNAVELVDEAQQEVDDARAVVAEVLAELAPPPPPPQEPDPLGPAPGDVPAAPGF